MKPIILIHGAKIHQFVLTEGLQQVSRSTSQKDFWLLVIFTSPPSSLTRHMLGAPGLAEDRPPEAAVPAAAPAAPLEPGAMAQPDGCRCRLDPGPMTRPPRPLLGSPAT